MAGVQGRVRSRWRLAAGVGALIALVGAVLVGGAPASAAKNAADVVFIIDESSSMGDEIADVKAQIDAVVSTLTSQFDDRYGLVAFGGAPPGQPVQDPFTRTNMTDSASFKTALSSSNSYAVPGGSQERGLAATTYAMQSITGFRAGAGVCAILISDEAPSFQVDQATDLAQATAALAARGAAFFAITDTSLSGITGTYGPDPGSLAAASGGAVFSLTDFRADAVPVLQAISQRCVKTVQERGGSASFGAIPTTGLAPLPVTFTATAGEPDATYAWDFGDGSTGNGQVVSHTFTTVGSFTVKLTVTAPGFEPASASQRIVTRTEADGELGSLPTDCTIVGTGAANTTVVAAQQNLMDACVTGEPATTVINKQLAGCRMLFDTRSPEGAQALFGSDYPAATLYAQKEWIDSHQKEAQALTNAIIETLAFIDTHSPKEVVDKMPAEIQGTNKELYLELFTNMSHIFAKGGRFTEGGVKTCVDVLGSGIPEVAAANINPASLYTNKFVDASPLTRKT